MTSPHTSTTTTTTSRPNTAQAAAWNGPEAANWAEASTVAAPSDADLVGHLLAAAQIRPGELVLDVGCGTGDATRAAARAAEDVTALGIDLSRLMVDLATEAAADEGLANVTFVAGDAQVHPFWQDAFDVVISHFGVMFFDDPVAAFTNLAGALRPGGRLAFAVPQAAARCDWYTVPLAALAALAALTGSRPAAEDRPSQMFSLADARAIDDVLTAAGFADVVTEATPHDLWFGPDAAAAARFYARSGPVRATVADTPGLDEVRAERLLEEALQRHLGADGVRLPGEHWVVTARRG